MENLKFKLVQMRLRGKKLIELRADKDLIVRGKNETAAAGRGNVKRLYKQLDMNYSGAGSLTQFLFM